MKVLKYRFLLLAIVAAGILCLLLSFLTPIIQLRLIGYVVLVIFWMAILFLSISEWRENRISRKKNAETAERHGCPD